MPDDPARRSAAAAAAAAPGALFLFAELDSVEEEEEERGAARGAQSAQIAPDFCPISPRRSAGGRRTGAVMMRGCLVRAGPDRDRRC